MLDGAEMWELEVEAGVQGIRGGAETWRFAGDTEVRESMAVIGPC